MARAEAGRPRWGGPAGAAVCALLWLCVPASIVSCNGAPTPVPAPDGPAPDAAAVAAAQRMRLDALPTLALRGVAELRWSDEDGAHVEDGDFELVVRMPSDTALRVTKLGERVLWAGSGSGRWWLFEPKATPSRVRVGSADAPADDADAGLMGLMRPAQLLATLGIGPIEASQVRSVAWDSARGCWRAEVAAGSRSMVLDLRHASLLPIAVEWRDAQGRTQLRSELSEFAWPGAEGPAVQPGALVPTRILVSAFGPPGEPASAARDGARPQATLALRAGPPTDGRARARDRLFDFEELRAAMKPELVEEERP